MNDQKNQALGYYQGPQPNCKQCAFRFVNQWNQEDCLVGIVIGIELCNEFLKNPFLPPQCIQIIMFDKSSEVENE